MGMVRVALRLTAQPRRSDEIIQTLRSLMLPLRAASGLVSCRVLLDVDRPDAVCYEEEWRSSADLDRQIRSSHYTRLLALMEEAAEPPEIALHWVTHVRGLEYLEKVRLC
jgi:quinol monooxygenase YgiN